MFWEKGFAEAPHVVRVCAESWTARNPGWDLVQLDATNLGDYVAGEVLDRLRGLRGLSTKKFANLLRLYLVGRWGGVWADATCFCVKPLDEWLPERMDSGFFAFRRMPDAWLESASWVDRLVGSSKDRIVANWFFASLPDNVLALRMFQAHLGLFEENDLSLQGTPEGRSRLALFMPLLSRNAWWAQWWSHPALLRFTKAISILHFSLPLLEGPDD